MNRETILFDFTEGKKVFDTSKMEQWTEEEWKEWVGEPEDHVGIQKILINDSNIYLKLTSVYYDEATNDMHVTFEAQSKIEKNVSIQFGKWKVDNQEFDLSNLAPECLGENSELLYFKRSVDYMFIESALSMEVDIIDKTNSKCSRYEFILKLF